MTAEHNIKYIHIFKTNIKTIEEFNRAKSVLDTHKSISEWNIDMEDVDCVLRITAPEMTEQEIITMMSELGILCSELN